MDNLRQWPGLTGKVKKKLYQLVSLLGRYVGTGVDGDPQLIYYDFFKSSRKINGGQAVLVCSAECGELQRSTAQYELGYKS
ncbi:MAG: hypothetical protein CM15mP85_04740 [Rhodobacterales bacterium]|nr:MAG: hypothetical protein CM15mP85_04740 [Rhodobacterales bacterium]